jgi:hypothetical protein
MCFIICYALKIFPCLSFLIHAAWVFLPFRDRYDIIHVLQFCYIALILVPVNCPNWQKLLFYALGLACVRR